ncbi:MAG: hypothetical protein RIQ72_205 [Candidatus Parcubacteria bacterium]
MDKHRIASSAVLALGDIYTPKGKLILPVDGVVDRLRATCDWIDLSVGVADSTLLFASAGYAKRSRFASQLFPNDKRPLSLANQLSKYLAEHYGEDSSLIPSAKLSAEPLCWSTRNEVRVAIKRTKAWMKENGYDEQNSEVVFVVASHWAHLPRIWLYCKWYLPKEWSVKLVVAKHAFSLRSHLIEPPKFLRDCWLLRRVLSRLNRMKVKHVRYCSRHIPRGYGK